MIAIRFFSYRVVKRTDTKRKAPGRGTVASRQPDSLISTALPSLREAMSSNSMAILSLQRKDDHTCVQSARTPVSTERRRPSYKSTAFHVSNARKGSRPIHYGLDVSLALLFLRTCPAPYSAIFGDFRSFHIAPSQVIQRPKNCLSTFGALLAFPKRDML